jgi:hypothetical protein
MTDQYPGYREDWDITSEEGSLCFASAIYSRLVGGEQDEATLQWLAKYLRANAAPHHINLNHEVKVKLTDSGQDVLAMQQLRRQQDADGYIKFQLWELMNIFGVHVYNDCSIPFEFNRILLAPFDSAMTDQHQHRATPEQWAFTENRACCRRVSVYATSSCLVELRDRIQQLEATQHAHIEAKSSEAGARCAVEQMRSRPGSWQPLKVETTYGSDASIPTLSQSDVKAAEMEWARTAPGMRSDATDRVLALENQIRDGSLTLVDALKKINSEPIERTWQTTYLVEKIRVKMIKEQKNSNSWQALAEAVLREVAEWLRSEYPQRKGFGSAPWANLIDNEANL